MMHEFREMLTQDSGATVNSSLGGLVGLAGRAAHHASKHDVIGLTKSTALEYAAGHPHQRDLPRDDRTPTGRRDDHQRRTQQEEAVANQPIARLGQASEMAAA